MDPGTVLGGRQVSLAGLQFGVVDASGVAWRIGADGLQGWDSAEVRSTLTQREAAHGAWMGPTYLGERVITLAGTIAAPTEVLAAAAVERLLAAAPLDGLATLTVWEPVPKQAQVRQSGKSIVKWETDTTISWSLLLTAPDPRRHSTDLRQVTTGLPATTGGLVLPATTPWTMSAVATSGIITAANEGSITTLPLLQITGPVQEPSITTLYPDGTVTALRYGGTLGSGDVLTLDTAEHTAIVGGATRRRYLSGTWPQIPPGGSQFLFQSTAYTPAATLTATWRAAWK